MTGRDEVVRDIARLIGIGDHYRDQTGQIVHASSESQAAILFGIGLDVSSEGGAQDALERVHRLKRGLVPALVPAVAGRAAAVPVRADGATVVQWSLTDEGGAAREGRAPVEQAGGEPSFQLPALRPGYHRLTVKAGRAEALATVIAAPSRCFEPAALRVGAHLWGTTAQVYGLRSPRNLGIGDYSDVAEVAERTGLLGASFLGLSPVHALFGADRSKVSPYSPSSRLFLETLFIDPFAMPGFDAAGRSVIEHPDMQAQVQALREALLVDHAAVAVVKQTLFEALWPAFEQHNSPSFESFRRRGGAALEAHATFEALSEAMRAQGHNWAGVWPSAYRSARSPEVAAFRREQASRVAFHAWLQWLADGQLATAAQRARASGMGIGLYRDLAVGADAAGSEIWADPDRFAPGLSIGSPPDPFGPTGQNWGLPPFNPLVLEEQGLAAFRALVSANMRHAGAIRIDHAFQLQRLFLIPAGSAPARGVYVAYPFEAMLAVLRLESHRARALVIAEDLGTAPEGFSDAIMQAGLLSYRVLWFERLADGAFKPASEYPRSALATFTTHDLPTFRGWWRGLDIDLRETLGIFNRDLAETERAARRADVRQFGEALAQEGLLAGSSSEEAPLEAMMRFLARTPSALVGIQLEDAAGELNQANLPGPDQGYPNWRRRNATETGVLTAAGGELARIAAALTAEGRGAAPRPSALAMPPPRATYRIQFHKDFTFEDALELVPYLAKLGISHLYASPILTARPGSVHGYDIVDHDTINPELGGEDGFCRLTDALGAAGLGLVLDIVPNHMGVGGADNGWWLSLLEWGELSPHGRAFDIDWQRLDANGKLILPFLGSRYGEALEAGELPVAYEAADGAFSAWHYEHRFPLNPLTYPIILDRALAALPDDGVEGGSELLAISARLRTLDEESAERRPGAIEESASLKQRLAQAVARSPMLQQAIDRALALVNGTPGIPDSFGTLHRILEAQAYRLAHWRVAASDINYRRFFDINSLAGLRVEDTEIFARSHATIFRLVREGRIQGLRIDHVDGLADPEGYLRALQNAVGPGFYVVIEKILEPGEALRLWPVAGTTGYDALNLLDAVFVERQAESALERIYRAASGLDGRYGELLRRAKAEILVTSFASELEMLVSDLKRYADADRRTRDYTAFSIRGSLVEIVARFPTYRSYLGEGEATAEDRALIEHTISGAKRGSSLPDLSVHDLVGAALLEDVEGMNRPGADLLRRFRRRFQQITGPVMAKSLEDTLFYRYVRLLSLNEVGGDPNHFGVAIEDFHRANKERALIWPNAMIATATHDTKRGEDTRARLTALAEMPDSWSSALERYAGLIAPAVKSAGDAPDENDRYMILQAILGAWPPELLDAGDSPEAIEAFRRRIEEYTLKALREAKRRTSWVNADESYENAATSLVAHLLAPGAPFLAAMRPLARRLAYVGMLTALSRTVLKATVPGVPDFYQGTERWDLSLVDPDNRRPVDFAIRRAAAEETPDWPALLETWRDGRVKQQVIARLLQDRARHPVHYAMGDYRPLVLSGALAEHLVAFERRSGSECLAVIVPRLMDRLTAGEAPPLAAVWRDTCVDLTPGAWTDIVTGSQVHVGSPATPISELFKVLPFSVLRIRS